MQRTQRMLTIQDMAHLAGALHTSLSWAFHPRPFPGPVQWSSLLKLNGVPAVLLPVFLFGLKNVFQKRFYAFPQMPSAQMARAVEQEGCTHPGESIQEIFEQLEPGRR
jgi:hypothetical protein